MSRKSDWHFPPPRNGLAGQWDRFVGPGATVAEQLIGLLPAAIAAVAIVFYAHGEKLNWTLIQYIVAALLAFDIVGGVTTNATSSAKRWYHRNTQTVAKHLGFIAIHIMQIFLVGWLFRDLDVAYIVGVYVYLMTAAVSIIFTPVRIQRSVALLLVCGAIIISLYAYSPTPGFEWFIPVLFLKLLVSHLTFEEPYA